MFPPAISRLRPVALACAMVIVMSSSVCVAETTVVRRGGLAPVSGRLVAITDAGVEIVERSGRRGVVPWDRVRTLLGDGEDDADYVARRAFADQVWRGRSRLERGDHRSAEPLFLQAFERTRHATHETALIVAEGLLRCALHRGDHVRAVAPFLEVIRIRRSGVASDAYAAMEPVVDEALWLCGALPPYWVDTRSVGRLVSELEPWLRSADTYVAEVAALYRRAAMQQRPDHDGVASPERSSTRRVTDSAGERGLRLLRLCVEAAGDPERSLSALFELRSEPAARPTERAWTAFAIGHAMIRSESDDTRLEGAVFLLHLPAIHAREFPYAAGLALAYARDARRAAGREGEAEILDRELNTRFPGHPVRHRATGLFMSTSDQHQVPGDSA